MGAQGTITLNKDHRYFVFCLHWSIYLVRHISKTTVRALEVFFKKTDGSLSFRICHYHRFCGTDFLTTLYTSRLHPAAMTHKYLFGWRSQCIEMRANLTLNWSEF